MQLEGAVLQPAGAVLQFEGGVPQFAGAETREGWALAAAAGAVLPNRGDPLVEAWGVAAPKGWDLNRLALSAAPSGLGCWLRRGLTWGSRPRLFKLHPFGARSTGAPEQGPVP